MQVTFKDTMTIEFSGGTYNALELNSPVIHPFLDYE